MADVFLSYKRDERSAVETIASHLRDLGLTVWFDASMSAGETFNAEIDREARAAKVVLVCWSPAARQSEWVNAEAMIGFEQKKLAACYVAGPDGFSAPTPFNASHTEDLRVWLAAPSSTDPVWKSVLRRIGKLCGRTDIESWATLDARSTATDLRAWIQANNASPMLMMVDELLRVRERADDHREKVERETRERYAREASEREARHQAERQARDAAARAWDRDVKIDPTGPVETTRIRARFEGIAIAIAAAVAFVVFMIWATQQTLTEQTRRSAEETSVPTLETSNTSRSWRVGQEFDDCGGANWCPRMVVVPAGRFLMGSPHTEAERNDDEGPQHEVAIGQFAVGKYEVTISEWSACVNRGGCPTDQLTRQLLQENGDHPAHGLSWNDTQNFVRWLSHETGQNYRLLTEAEWEYAARAGTTTPYPTGTSINTSLARYDSPDVAVVGSFAPNGFGLHDMLGNVYEWVEDCYHSDYRGAPTDGSAWVRANRQERVGRGAGVSFHSIPLGPRSAYRDQAPPNLGYDNWGFRVARDL